MSFSKFETGPLTMHIKGVWVEVEGKRQAENCDITISADPAGNVDSLGRLIDLVFCYVDGKQVVACLGVNEARALGRYLTALAQAADAIGPMADD